MPPIRSLVLACCAYIVVLILLLGKIMPIYSYCAKKKLVYIIIAALFNYQPFSCSKYIKLNIYFACNIWLVFNTKYIFLFSIYLFLLPYPLGGNT